jgi:hypothetical protein
MAGRENGVGWSEKMALVDLTVGLNQHLRIFGETSINRTINLMKLVNQDLGWFQTFLV